MAAISNAASHYSTCPLYWHCCCFTLLVLNIFPTEHWFKECLSYSTYKIVFIMSKFATSKVDGTARKWTEDYFSSMVCIVMMELVWWNLCDGTCVRVLYLAHAQWLGRIWERELRIGEESVHSLASRTKTSTAKKNSPSKRLSTVWLRPVVVAYAKYRERKSRRNKQWISRW